jgi:hypothetical protein
VKTETAREDAFAARITAIERRLDALDAARNSGNTTIDQPGTFTVRTDDGNDVFIAGILPDGRMAVQIGRDDGTRALSTSGGAGQPQFVGMWDRLGNLILADDTVSGAGLALPNLPVHFVSGNALDYNSISGSSFATGTVASTLAIRQQPRLRVQMVVQASDPTTAGELQLWDELHGTQLGDVVAVPAGAYTFFTLGPVNVESVCALHSDLYVSVRARVTAGAGSLRCAVADARGMGS